MFTAMGVGAFSAGAFHLMTHAFFKALLFLGSGSVIHAMGGEQDMRHMGGLRKYLPVTYATMFVGTLAIAGIPPFAGFFSKDEILFRAFEHNRVIWVLGGRDRADDGVLHVPPDGDDVSWRVPRSRMGTGGPRRVSMPAKASRRDTQVAAAPRRGAPGRSARPRPRRRARSRSGAWAGGAARPDAAHESRRRARRSWSRSVARTARIADDR